MAHSMEIRMPPDTAPFPYTIFVFLLASEDSNSSLTVVESSTLHGIANRNQLRGHRL